MDTYTFALYSAILIYCMVSWLIRFNIKDILLSLEDVISIKVNDLSEKVNARIDIQEDSVGELNVRVDKIYNKQKNTFQAWTGYFEYNFLGRRVEGYVEILNTSLFTQKENEDWMNSVETSSRDKYLIMMANDNKYMKRTNNKTCYMECTGWNNTVICSVKIYEGYGLFIRVEEAMEHAPKIEWKRRLISS